jgi:hypothetical protein
MGEISGLMTRPTTAFPAHSMGGMISSTAATGVRRWVMVQLYQGQSRGGCIHGHFVAPWRLGRGKRPSYYMETSVSHIQSRAIRIDQHGGPDQLKLVDVTVGDPGPGEIRIRHKAVGLNFIDVYQRSGLYAMPLPLQLGMEASGVVEAVG